jgi:transposase
MNLEYFEDLFDASCRVWTEKEIKEVKVVAKMLIHAGFTKAQVAHWLDVSKSSIYNWAKKGLM